MKENIIKNDFHPDRRGGSRDETIKVSEDTINCIITPIVDFPIISTSSIALYLNSKLGPNSKKTNLWKDST